MIYREGSAQRSCSESEILPCIPLLCLGQDQSLSSWREKVFRGALLSGCEHHSVLTGLNSCKPSQAVSSSPWYTAQPWEMLEQTCWLSLIPLPYPAHSVYCTSVCEGYILHQEKACRYFSIMQRSPTCAILFLLKKTNQQCLLSSAY